MVKIIGCLDNEMLAVKDNEISGYKIQIIKMGQN